MALYTFFSGLTEQKDLLESILSDIYDYYSYENVRIESTKDFKIQDKVMHSIMGQTQDKEGITKAFGHYRFYYFDAELPTINNLDGTTC